MQATAQAPLGADLDLVRGSRRPWPAHQGYRGRLVGQSGRVVRLLRLRFHVDLFRGCVFPSRRYDEPADGDGGYLRRRVFHATAGWLAVRMDRRHARSQELDGDLGADDVRRLADDRHSANLRDHRCRGAGPAAGRAPGAGTFGRWRIRDRRDLHERGRRQGPSRLLFVFPVRDTYRRAASGAPGSGGICKLRCRWTNSRPGAGASPSSSER